MSFWGSRKWPPYILFYLVVTYVSEKLDYIISVKRKTNFKTKANLGQLTILKTCDLWENPYDAFQLFHLHGPWKNFQKQNFNLSTCRLIHNKAKRCLACFRRWDSRTRCMVSGGWVELYTRKMRGWGPGGMLGESEGMPVNIHIFSYILCIFMKTSIVLH